MHARTEFGAASVTVCVPRRPAIVLGSHQDESDVDVDIARRLGVDVARRRSGGGAVWLHPDDSVWIDVWVPRADPVWVDDVAISGLFLGDAFAAALVATGAVPPGAATVVRGAFAPGEHGHVICFAGEAPGEVVGPDGKIVGVSQRRDRHGARLQCVLYRRWVPSQWRDLLTGESARAALDLLPVHAVDVGVDDLVGALVTSLDTGA